MSTVVAQVTILDPIGLHARPVGQIVKLVNLSGLEVRIGRLGESGVKANSPLSILALKGKTGEELTLEIDTKDQELANDLVAHVQEILKGQPLD